MECSTKVRQLVNPLHVSIQRLAAIVPLTLLCLLLLVVGVAGVIRPTPARADMVDRIASAVVRMARSVVGRVGKG